MITPMSAKPEYLKMTINYQNGQRINKIYFNWDELYNYLELMKQNELVFVHLYEYGFVNEPMILSQDMFYNNGQQIKNIKVEPYDVAKEDIV